MCCKSCCHQPQATPATLFHSSFNHHAGRLSSAQSVFAFSNVLKADRVGEAVKVYLVGADHTQDSGSGLVWLYGDDRQRFFREWDLFEQESNL